MPDTIQVKFSELANISFADLFLGLTIGANDSPLSMAVSPSENHIYLVQRNLAQLVDGDAVQQTLGPSRVSVISNAVFDKVVAHPTQEEVAQFCGNSGVFMQNASTNQLSSNPIVSGVSCIDIKISKTGKYMMVEDTSNAQHQFNNTILTSVTSQTYSSSEKVFTFALINNADQIIKGAVSNNKSLTINNIQNNSNINISIAAVTNLSEVTDIQVSNDNKQLVAVQDTGQSVQLLLDQTLVKTENQNMTNVMVLLEAEDEMLVQIQGNAVTVLNITRGFEESEVISSLTSNGFQKPSFSSVQKDWVIVFPKVDLGSTIPTQMVILQRVKNLDPPVMNQAQNLASNVTNIHNNDSQVVISSGNSSEVKVMKYEWTNSTLTNTQSITMTGNIQFAKLHPENKILQIVANNVIEIYAQNETTHKQNPATQTTNNKMVLSYNITGFEIDYLGKQIIILTNNQNAVSNGYKIIAQSMTEFNDGSSTLDSPNNQFIDFEPVEDPQEIKIDSTNQSLFIKYKKSLAIYQKNSDQQFQTKYYDLVEDPAIWGFDNLGKYAFTLINGKELLIIDIVKKVNIWPNIFIERAISATFSPNSAWFMVGFDQGIVNMQRMNGTQQLLEYQTTVKFGAPVQALQMDRSNTFLQTGQGTNFNIAKFKFMQLLYAPLYTAQEKQNKAKCINNQEALGTVQCSTNFYSPLALPSGSNNTQNQSVSDTVNADGYQNLFCNTINIEIGKMQCGQTDYTLKIKQSSNIVDKESVMVIPESTLMVSLPVDYYCFVPALDLNQAVLFGNLVYSSKTLNQGVYSINLNCTAPPQQDTIHQFFFPQGIGSFCQTYKPDSIYTGVPICETCKSGFELKAGYCTQPILNCATYFKWDCSVCDKGYQILGGNPYGQQCSQIQEQCKTFDEQTDQCTTCDTGWGLFLLEGAAGTQWCFQDVCVVRDLLGAACSTCASGQNVNTNGICQSVTQDCKVHTAAECTECNSGFQLLNALCYAVPSHCAEFDSAPEVLKCVSCAQYFQLDASSVCMANPSQCIYYDKLNTFCNQCKEDQTWVASDCVLRDSVNCFFQFFDTCVDIWSFFAIIQVTFLIQFSIQAFTMRTLQQFPHPKSQTKTVKERVDPNKDEAKPLTSRDEMVAMDVLDQSNILTYAPNKAIMAFRARKILRESSIAKYFVTMNRNVQMWSILLNVIVILLPGVNIMYLIWMVIDSIRHEAEQEKQKEDFEQYCITKMRMIQDDFHEIMNNAVVQMNKNIMLNQQPQVFDSEMIRKKGFLECFTGFIVYEDGEQENGLNKITFKKEFSKYFDIPVKGQFITVAMLNEQFDPKYFKEEMKMRYSLTYKMIEFEVDVLLVENQYFVDNYKLYIERLVDKKQVSTHMTQNFGSGHLNRSYNQHISNNVSPRSVRSNVQINKSFDEGKRNQISNEENVDIEFKQNEAWMKYDLIHLAIRKHLIKPRQAINLEEKTIIFDENDLSIVIQGHNTAECVWELNMNCEKSTLLWEAISASFLLKEQTEHLVDKYTVFVKHYEELAIYYSVWENSQIVNLITNNESNLNQFITNFIREVKWTKTLIDYYKVKQRRKTKIQKLETEISGELGDHLRHSILDGRKSTVEQEDDVVMRSQSKPKLTSSIKRNSSANKEMEFRSQFSHHSHISKDEALDQLVDENTLLKKRLDSMMQQNNNSVSSKSKTREFNQRIEDAPDTLHNNKLDNLENKLNNVGFPDTMDEFKDLKDDREEKDGQKSGVTDQIREYQKEDFAEHIEQTEMTYAAFKQMQKHYLEFKYKDTQYLMFGINTQNDTDYNEEIQTTKTKGLNKLDHVVIRSVMNPRNRFKAYMCLDEESGKLFIYSGTAQDHEKNLVLLSDVWEYDIGTEQWRLLIEFSKSEDTVRELSNRCESPNGFSYLRQNPIFMKNKNDILLCGGQDKNKIQINDGIKMKIERQMDNNSVEVEIGYVKTLLINHSIELGNEDQQIIKFTKNELKMEYSINSEKLNDMLLSSLVPKAIDLERHLSTSQTNMLEWVLSGVFQFVQMKGIDSIIVVLEDKNVSIKTKEFTRTE